MSALLKPLLPPRHGPEEFPHPQHPLVIQVRSSAGSPLRGDPSRPREALETVANPGIVCEAVGGGLNVYAATEAAADDVIRVLRAGRDAAFDCFGPEVRYWPGRPMREPVMSVSLDVPLIFGAFVRREVQRRRGCVHALEPARRGVSLRGEAPLAALLGFGRWLDALTDGRARLQTALLRYAPIGDGGSPDPGPLAA